MNLFLTLMNLNQVLQRRFNIQFSDLFLIGARKAYFKLNIYWKVIVRIYASSYFHKCNVCNHISSMMYSILEE